ncbi:family 20 glycosylhydrolase [Sphingobacterium sp. DR205]|uniref:family 20 glycosylhydrolase n=1 Tax=Sphingobacterium sp. DR205 TaxID=2713573 RepID=UPI0013E4F84B|nr:family 20 glycosylhydrolase [Sphingobacterium sp. DR205]QIH31990.1 family 20 glycosylhydrolase [Sphingobacterium sp. DR205]
MRLSQSLSLLLLGGTCIFGAQAQTNFDLIPKPSKVTVATGIYNIPTQLSVIVSDDFQAAAQLLTEHPAIKGLTFEVLKKNKKTPKEGFRIIKAVDADNLSKNAYSIQIDEKGLLLKAWDTPQVINGIYTLIQLGYLQTDPSQIAFATIVDEPRFSYRGLHLDVSRHFMPLSFVKKYIDVMAIYKFNNFHWHLTDGAGWRLEIKKYPELTQKAAWRTHAHWKDWWNNGRQYVEKGNPNANGGFYTQEEARELVDYAARKGINVIPEIEMPGHSEEVLAVYPELSCSGKPYSQGEFCIGNEKTFEFLKNVLDEVLTIFPSQYIHIGGDEAEKKHWEKCPKDQALMQKEGLKSVDELQSYAIKQMDLYLQSKGRKLIGWDEILQGGLTEGATVMSWRGEDGGINAANAGHDVIMTPGSHLYFDSYQTDPRTQPEAIGGYLTLDKVYSYDPIPNAIQADKAKHILGAQANIWTEYVPTTEHVEYMVFPRALALSEVNWTAKDTKSWADFQRRLQSHYKLLQELNLNYYRPSFNVAYTASYNAIKNNNKITLTTEQLNTDQIRYTIDGSEPTIQSTPYTGPFELSSTGHINAAYFQDSIKIGPTLSFDIDIHRAIGKKVTYNTQWSGYPAQKDSTLTNGLMGGLSYHDGQWQGFTSPIDVVVDLERREEIHQVAMNFMQMIGPGVYMPGEMEVLVSDNGRTFRSIGTVKNDVSDKESKLTFKRFELKLNKAQQARYIKIKASNPKKGYLFTDEIIVY